jgi:hypothetical protein
MKESTRLAIAEEVERVVSERCSNSGAYKKQALVSGVLFGLGVVAVLKVKEYRENRKHRTFQVEE